MDKVNGYILLFKQIQDNCMWQDKPFARGQAWIDLLMMANYKDGEMLVKGTVVKVKRGQVLRTLDFLADRWGWSKKKVRGFIKFIENQKMGHAEGTPQGMLITIEKYASFQDAGHAKGHAEGTLEGTQGYTKKEEIKKKKEGGFPRTREGRLDWIDEV